MSLVDTRFLDPEVLARLPNLELAARRLVEGMFVGYHRSPAFGYSVEFADHRDYVAGDDLRTVDWRVWARKDKYYVKRFDMESQLKGTILLDTSRSMEFGDGRRSKLTYGSVLAASLAYLLIHQNDMAGLVTFDSKVNYYVPPRGSRSHLRLILHALGTVQPGSATNVAAVCHHLAEIILSRGMIIVISDLLDDVTEVLQGLRHFQHKKHDLVVFHLLHDDEIELPYQELANFKDMENGRRLAIDPAISRNVYKQRVGDFVRQFKEGCLKTNIEYNLVRTSQPVETVLRNFVMFRARRAR